MTTPFIDVTIGLFGMAAIWFASRVFRTDSMVRASFSLLASFVCVAAIMIALVADYLGVATLFMMAVEMVIMALFMVAFMMNPAGLNPMSMVHQERLSLVLAAGGGLALLAVALVARIPLRPLTGSSTAIESLGLELLGDSMLVFETAGVTLLATMIGAVALSAASSRFGGSSDEGSVPPPLVPPPAEGDDT